MLDSTNPLKINKKLSCIRAHAWVSHVISACPFHLCSRALVHTRIRAHTHTLTHSHSLRTRSRVIAFRRFGFVYATLKIHNSQLVPKFLKKISDRFSKKILMLRRNLVFRPWLNNNRRTSFWEEKERERETQWCNCEI